MTLEMPEVPDWVSYRCTACGTVIEVPGEEANMVGLQDATEIAGTLILPLFTKRLLWECWTCMEFREHVPSD